MGLKTRFYIWINIFILYEAETQTLPWSPQHELNMQCYRHIIHGHAAAAAAKSLQSCPTLYDPIDGSPPGSPVPGSGLLFPSLEIFPTQESNLVSCIAGGFFTN